MVESCLRNHIWDITFFKMTLTLELGTLQKVWPIRLVSTTFGILLICVVRHISVRITPGRPVDLCR